MKRSKIYDLDGNNVSLEHNNVSKAWILTNSGVKFHHLAPTVDMIRTEDIAHSLSMQCRWTGHTKWHYSVAQHCYYCSFLVPRPFRKAALLHDAAEAYTGDMNRPLKHFTAAGPAFKEIEASIEEVIFEKYGVPFPVPEVVKAADAKMLYTERDQLLEFSSAVEYEVCKWGDAEDRADIRIQRWTPERAKDMFLRRFEQLNKAA